MMILHHGWRSSASRRVRLCLAEKGLAYEGRVVDMAAMEHHSPEYLRINPLGVIPTLIHDGRPLHESGTICEYLDETFPAPPLRPDTPYERAEMRNWIRHIDGLIGNLIIFNWRRRNGRIRNSPKNSRTSRARSDRRPGSGPRANPTPRKSATQRGPNWSCCWTRWSKR
jgi:glutathione S-transferase